MPKRLDPEKGLPGLFQSSKAPGSDMTFLVRSKKGSARRARPEPEPELEPEPVKPRARTTQRQPAKTPAPRPAPETPIVATTSTDAVAPPTSTSSGHFQRPVLVTVALPPPPAPAPGPELEVRDRLLDNAPPVCRVPEARPTPPALSWRELAGIAWCAVEWVGFAAKERFALVLER